MQLSFSISKIQTYWSTPKIMAALMLLGMMLIYGFESMGLSHREQNLGIRNSNPEVLIKALNFHKTPVADNQLSASSQSQGHHDYQESRSQLNQKLEHLKSNKNSNLLFKGAMDQFRSHHFDEGFLDLELNSEDEIVKNNIYNKEN